MTVKKFSFPVVSKKRLRDWTAGYLFASPFIIGFLAFFAFPMGYSLWMSFQKWDLLSPPKFVGLANFTKLLQDPVANLSLYNSAYYTIIAVPLQLIVRLWAGPGIVTTAATSRSVSGWFLYADPHPDHCQRGGLAACLPS